MRDGAQGAAKRCGAGQESVQLLPAFENRGAKTVERRAILQIHWHERGVLPGLGDDLIVELFQGALGARHCDDVIAGFGQSQSRCAS